MIAVGFLIDRFTLLSCLSLAAMTVGCGKPNALSKSDGVAVHPVERAASEETSPRIDSVDQMTIGSPDKDVVDNDDVESDVVDGDDPLADHVEAKDRQVEPGGESETTLRPDPVTADASEPDSSESVPVDVDPKAAYQLWVPTAYGPLLIGLDIAIGNQTLQEAYLARLHQVRSDVSDEAANEDEPLQWQDLIPFVAQRPDQFGPSASNVSQQSKQLIQRYDRNSNGNVEHDELERFLFRDSRFSGEFRTFGTDHYRWSNRASSRLFQAIDQNDDRLIDDQEIEASASWLLRLLDQNADECISLSEAVVTDDPDRSPWRNSKSERDGTVAMDLSGYVNWNQLAFTMEGMIGEPAVYADSNPIRAIDMNHDGGVSADEARQILDVSPAVRLYVGIAKTYGAGSLDLRLGSDVADDFAVQKVTEDVAWVGHGKVNLVVSLNDTPVGVQRLPREAFDLIDANGDGGIDAKELPEQAREQIQIEQLDVDGDGKLTFDEINAAGTQSKSIWAVQVRGRCAEYPDALFAWLDQDHDHFLSTREIHTAPSRLRSIVDQGTRLGPADLPETIHLQLTRGTPEQDEARFAMNRIHRQSVGSLPRWALALDVNRDFEISKREFIGPVDVFHKIDRNGDGFLDGKEIRTVPAD